MKSRHFGIGFGFCPIFPNRSRASTKLVFDARKAAGCKRRRPGLGVWGGRARRRPGAGRGAGRSGRGAVRGAGRWVRGDGRWVRDAGSPACGCWALAAGGVRVLACYGPRVTEGDLAGLAVLLGRALGFFLYFRDIWAVRVTIFRNNFGIS